MLEKDTQDSQVASAVAEAKRDVALQTDNQEDDTGK
jgi:hypothetical protein